MSIGQRSSNENMANTSGSSTRNSFEEEESSTFDFSDQGEPFLFSCTARHAHPHTEDHSSSSSDAEYEQQLTKDSPVMPQTPVKRPPSSPEIVITKAVRAPEPEMIDGRRPRMRLGASKRALIARSPFTHAALAQTFPLYLLLWRQAA